MIKLIPKPPEEKKTKHATETPGKAKVGSKREEPMK